MKGHVFINKTKSSISTISDNKKIIMVVFTSYCMLAPALLFIFNTPYPVINKALALITGTSLLTYFIINHLIRMIVLPITRTNRALAHIIETNDHSLRIAKNESPTLNTIINQVNIILDQREKIYNNFKHKSEKLQRHALHSKLAMDYFHNEFKIPFRSANAFRNMLENQVFGPVNPVYLEYFNDLCHQDIELYCVINKVLELYKAQGNIFEKHDEAFCIDSIISTMLHKHANNININNISTSINIENFLPDATSKKTIEMFIDNIIAVFTTCTHGNRKYKNYVTLKNTENSDIILIARMQDADMEVLHHNDNNRIINIGTLINSIRNFENLFEDEKIQPFINLNSMLVRSKIFIMDFLSSVYNSPIEIALKQHEATFTVTIKNTSSFIENRSENATLWQ